MSVVQAHSAQENRYLVADKAIGSRVSRAGLMSEFHSKLGSYFWATAKEATLALEQLVQSLLGLRTSQGRLVVTTLESIDKIRNTVDSEEGRQDWSSIQARLSKRALETHSGAEQPQR